MSQVLPCSPARLNQMGYFGISGKFHHQGKFWKKLDKTGLCIICSMGIY
jgi:hypothetical protein